MSTVRFIAFILTALTALFMPWFVFVGVAGIYAFVFSPYELVCIALCIDAQFGDVSRGFWSAYFYTVVTLVLMVVALYTKPFLSAYK